MKRFVRAHIATIRSKAVASTRRTNEENYNRETTPLCPQYHQRGCGVVRLPQRLMLLRVNRCPSWMSVLASCELSNDELAVPDPVTAT